MTTVATVDLERLPAIGLADLTASAALLTRVDRKYVLTVDDLDGLWDRLPHDALVLEIGGRRSFGYTSTYLDTPDLASFHDAAYCRRRRWKVRTRSYATGGHFLEVKTRRGAATVKERIAWRDTTRLDTVGRDFVEASLRSAGTSLDATALAPALRTSYDRTTLLLPSSGARVTLDLGLAWTTPDGVATRRLGERVVLETKSGMTPSGLDRQLWRLGHRPQRLSKYAVGMAALHSELPHNRWHRLLGTLAGDPA